MKVPGTDAQDTSSVEIVFHQNIPFIYKDGEGNVRGIAKEIIQPIMDVKGYDATYREMGSDECFDVLKRGEGDLLLGCNIEKRGKENISFSMEPIYSNWGVLYSNGDFPLSTIMDLEKSWIGVVKDDIYYTGDYGLKNVLDSFGIDASFVEFQNFNELAASMENGNVDVGVMNSALGSFMENDWDIVRTSVIFSPVDIGMAVYSNNLEMVDLLTGIDRELGELKNDPDSIYFDTLEDHLGNENERPTKFILPEWVTRTILVLLGAVILLGGTALFLRERVRARTRDLERTNEILNRDIDKRRKVERKLKNERNRSLFYLDLLIHDIGNIHQGLYNYIQLYDMFKEDREKAGRNVTEMKKLLDRSKGLMNNIHKFTEAVSTEKELKPIDISETMRDSMASVILSSPDLEIETDMDVPDEKMMVDCEPMIEEVFHNLFHNAVKFQQGPLIRIELKVRKEGDRYIITVSDHGKGIPDNMKSSVFGRLERSTERKHRGMGLTIVRVLVQRYGGAIEVTDRVEGDHSKGASFVLRLPVSKRAVDHIPDSS